MVRTEIYARRVSDREKRNKRELVDRVRAGEVMIFRSDGDTRRLDGYELNGRKKSEEDDENIHRKHPEDDEVSAVEAPTGVYAWRRDRRYRRELLLSDRHRGRLARTTRGRLVSTSKEQLASRKIWHRGGHAV